MNDLSHLSDLNAHEKQQQQQQVYPKLSVSEKNNCISRMTFKMLI